MNDSTSVQTRASDNVVDITRSSTEIARRHLTRDQAVEISTEIQEALNAISEKHSLKLELTETASNDMEIDCRFKLSMVDDLGFDQSMRDYLEYASSFNLDASWLSKQFKTKAGSRVYRIVGLSMKGGQAKVKLLSEGNYYYATTENVHKAMTLGNKKKTGLSLLGEQIRAQKNLLGKLLSKKTS